MLHRLAKSTYKLEWWNESINYYSTLVQSYPSNVLAKKELVMAKQRLLENQTGNYDMKFIVNESLSKKSHPLFFDVADYKNHAIKVIETTEKGRGLVAIDDIQKGTLLICSKAFSMSYNDTKSFTAICINPDSPTIYRKNSYYSMGHTIETILNNPHRTFDVYNLCAGTLGKVQNIPDGIIDPHRIEQIIATNCFGPGNDLLNTPNYGKKIECDL